MVTEGGDNDAPLTPKASLPLKPLDRVFAKQTRDPLSRDTHDLLFTFHQGGHIDRGLLNSNAMTRRLMVDKFEASVACAVRTIYIQWLLSAAHLFRANACL